MVGMMMGWEAPQQGWRKGPWTPEEDKLLSEYVHLHGEGRWSSVARSTGLNRSGKSCRLRWVNYLRPGLKRGHITPQEEGIIIELHALWGNKWSTIARYLPGRTDNEIKNYWRTHFKKRERSSSQKQEKRRAAQILKLKQHKQQQQQQEADQAAVHEDHDDEMMKRAAEKSNDKLVNATSQASDDHHHHQVDGVRPEKVFMYPSLEDQCLPVMAHNQEGSAAAAAAWLDQCLMDEAAAGGLWSGLWNLDDAYPHHYCNKTAAMQISQDNNNINNVNATNLYNNGGYIF